VHAERRPQSCLRLFRKSHACRRYNQTHVNGVMLLPGRVATHSRTSSQNAIISPRYTHTDSPTPLHRLPIRSITISTSNRNGDTNAGQGKTTAKQHLPRPHPSTSATAPHLVDSAPTFTHGFTKPLPHPHAVASPHRCAATGAGATSPSAADGFPISPWHVRHRERRG